MMLRMANHKLDYTKFPPRKHTEYIKKNTQTILKIFK